MHGALYGSWLFMNFFHLGGLLNQTGSFWCSQKQKQPIDWIRMNGWLAHLPSGFSGPATFLTTNLKNWDVWGFF